MKKFTLILVIVLIFSFSIVGCSNSQTSELSIGTYVFEASDDIIKPTISLEKDNKFSFTYSGLSSYLPMGTYTIDNNRLLLNTDDTADNKKIVYVFEIKNETLIFSADKSTPIPSFANVPDGAVFKK